jgi:hypothetical protein
VRKTWDGTVVVGVEITQFSGSLLQAATLKPQHKLDQRSQGIPKRTRHKFCAEVSDEFH